MNIESRNFDEHEMLDKDEQAVSQMVAGLKHVEAPANFERRVMARIAEPQEIRRSIFAIPAIAYGLPLVLVLMLATFFVIKLRQPSSGQPTVAENIAPAAEPQTNTQARQPELPTLPAENNSTVAQAPDTDKISTGDGHTAQKPQAPSRQKGGGSYEEALTPKKAPLPTGIQLNPQSNSNRSDVVSTVPISVKEMLSTLGLNVDYEKGWKVSSVNKNSVAERAGIAAGDEILSLGDKDLTAGTSFQGSASINTIRYSRNGIVKTANIH